MKARRTKRQAASSRGFTVKQLAAIIADAVVERISSLNLVKDAAVPVNSEIFKQLIALVDVADEALCVEQKSDTSRFRRKSAKSPTGLKSLVIVRRNLLALLQQLGVERVDPTGLPIDYVTHDPVLLLPTSNPDEDGLVAETIRPGYNDNNGKQIRPAMVVVKKYEPQQTKDKKKGEK